MWRYPVGEGAKRSRGRSMAGRQASTPMAIPLPRKYNRAMIRLAGLLGAFLAWAPMGARAAVMQPSSVEELARLSDAVVHGRVEAQEARWSGDHRLIVTMVTITASEVWRGQAPVRLTERAPVRARPRR